MPLLIVALACLEYSCRCVAQPGPARIGSARLRNWIQCWPRPTSKGQAQKTWFLCNENIVLAVFRLGHTAIASLAIAMLGRLQRERSVRVCQEIHDCYSRIVQKYSDGLTGGAGANLNMSTANDYLADVQKSTSKLGRSCEKIQNNLSWNNGNSSNNVILFMLYQYTYM